MTKSEHLFAKRPELIESYKGMTKEQLIEEISGEVLDLLDMVDRVQLFNSECTLSMSRPTYKLDDIKREINERKEFDIDQFCANLIDDGTDDEDILKEIKERGKKYLQ